MPLYDAQQAGRLQVNILIATEVLERTTEWAIIAPGFELRRAGWIRPAALLVVPMGEATCNQLVERLSSTFVSLRVAQVHRG